METQHSVTVPARPRLRRHGERGQGMAEYALILVLVVIGLIVIVSVIGKQDTNMWSNITNGLNGH